MTTPDPKAEAEAREAPSVFDTVNAECARELDAARAARCERCLGRGIVGHMGIGHDQCPACRGLGARAGHDVNLFLVAIALRDRLVTERDQRNAALALLDEARGELSVAEDGFAEIAEKYRLTAGTLADVAAEAQRLRDLVRYVRSDLHDHGLITDEEYAALASDHGAVARLEGYDALRTRLAHLTAEREGLRGQLARVTK